MLMDTLLSKPTGGFPAGLGEVRPGLRVKDHRISEVEETLEGNLPNFFLIALEETDPERGSDLPKVIE